MRGERLIRCARGGLNPVSLIARTRFGYTGPPRFAGVRISAPDVSSSWGIAYHIASGEYDFPGLKPRRGGRVIDIGANIGIFALWAARQGASVMSYEPAPSTLEDLLTNTRENPLISVVGAAVVGATPASPTVRLYLHDERSTRNTLLGWEIGTGDRLERHVDVRAIAIEEVLADGCDLLKIDCEGGEFDILGQAAETTLRRARRILVEFHRTAGDPARLLERLREAGFHASVLAGKDPAEPFGVIGGQQASV